MDVKIRGYQTGDEKELAAIWNQVVEEGLAFPQVENMTLEQARTFFSSQDFTGVALVNEKIAGLYILHSNNVGRCGHQANASYAVRSDLRGKKVGERLIVHSLKKAREAGYRLMQFNAVVKSNRSAVHLYEKLGFEKVGEVPGGFLLKNGNYEDILLYYYVL